MTIIDWFTILWPVGVLVIGIAVRIEVAQRLNKQWQKQTEASLAREVSDRKEAVASLHARQTRHEAVVERALGDIQRDIKTLLARP